MKLPDILHQTGLLPLKMIPLGILPTYEMKSTILLFGTKHCGPKRYSQGSVYYDSKDPYQTLNI